MRNPLDHEGLVHSVANRYRNMAQGVAEIDDLVQEGWIGLLKAVRDFDPLANASFSTYAHAKIEGEIRRFLRQQPFGLHYPQSVYGAYTRIRREGLEEKSDAVVASRLGVSRAIVEASRHLYTAPLDLEGGANEEHVPLSDLLGQTDDYSAVEVVEPFQRTLPPAQQAVLMLLWQGDAQREIAKKLSITQKTVSVRLKRIRGALEAYLGVSSAGSRRKRVVPRKVNLSPEEW